jgi:hypothetical protein
MFSDQSTNQWLVKQLSERKVAQNITMLTMQTYNVMRTSDKYVAIVFSLLGVDQQLSISEFVRKQLPHYNISLCNSRFHNIFPHFPLVSERKDAQNITMLTMQTYNAIVLTGCTYHHILGGIIF